MEHQAEGLGAEVCELGCEDRCGFVVDEMAGCEDGTLECLCDEGESAAGG